MDIVPYSAFSLNHSKPSQDQNKPITVSSDRYRIDDFPRSDLEPQKELFALLGNTTVFASAIEPKHASKSTKTAYLMQQCCSNLLGKHKIGVCHKVSVTDDKSVPIYKTIQSGKLRYGGLMTCGLGWVCPICAARISARRRIELAYIIGKVMTLGYKVAMVTYTLRHSAADELNTLLNVLTGSYRSSKEGRGYQRLKEQYGIVGSIRTLEITVGKGRKDSGWHPHYHELLVYRDGDAGDLGADLYERYAAAVRKRGGDLDRKHGLQVETTDDKISDYVAKWGHIPLAEWSLAHEMGGTIKTGRREDRRSMWHLLYDCTFTARASDQDLWRHYVACTYKRHQMDIAPAIRKLTGVEEVSDAVAAYDADMQQDEQVIFTLSAAIWSEVCKRQLRSRVLDLADGCDLLTFQRRMMAELRGMVEHVNLSGVMPTSSYSSGIS